MRLLCSHGGRLVPCGPGGGLRYVGGETRALAVPRGAPFRELTARLAEKAGAGGDAVTAVRYRLADGGLDEDLLVSVTSDEELAHMRDEYDRLRATRPSASFRVFVSTAAGVQQQRRQPVAPPMMMRRARSAQELAGRLARRPCPPAGRSAAAPSVRRVHSAQELAAGGGHSRQCFDDRRRLQSCCWCCHRRRDQCAAVPQPARPVRQLPAAMSKNVNGARQAAPAVSAAAKATGPVVFELENRRACWEFE
ncbi:hypothetical protein DAI22_03g297900 [Oryza sativa Japonica Group]|uniref:PB1 domain containing protein n=2 Tax=Oryza sativa subsp. japonica TaxID=39947 RepID=Q10EX0_ORYSJ|nr:putative PB1 domain containing protein [Oryza sativa Japonica Group]ABF98296.1 PB1 domain containing protein [Oryza sativa Japonica Group]KAF2940761.1 hypothetical protein DAI22_03g297900 [Oryza sativa Japonica Group]